MRSIRFVVENGGQLPELQSRGRLLNFIAYTQMDVILVIGLLCLVSSVIVFFVIFKVVAAVTSCFQLSKMKNE